MRNDWKGSTSDSPTQRVRGLSYSSIRRTSLPSGAPAAISSISEAKRSRRLPPSRKATPSLSASRRRADSIDTSTSSRNLPAGEVICMPEFPCGLGERFRSPLRNTVTYAKNVAHAKNSCRHPFEIPLRAPAKNITHAPCEKRCVHPCQTLRAASRKAVAARRRFAV